MCLDGGLHPREEESREHPHPVLPEQHCQQWPSRSPKLILLLSRGGKSKSGSQSNYCLGCLLCCQPCSSEQTKETEQIKAGTTSNPSPSRLEVLISQWRKGSLKEFTRAEPLKAQPLGVMCELQEWQHRAWVGISPLNGFVLLFFSITALAKGRFNGIISKRKPGNGGTQQISLTTKDSSLEINTWKAERIEQIASGMHKLCHILSDCRFWDTVRTAWDEDCDECLNFLLWPFYIHPFCLESSLKWSHSFHYPQNHLLNSFLLSLSEDAVFFFGIFYFLYFCIIYRSFPNTSENVIFHLPEAEPGDLFGCTFLSQGKGVILHKSDFVDLVILGPVMVECCSLNPKQEQYKDTKGSFTCPQHKKFGFPSSEPALSCSPKHSWSRAGPHWHLSTGTIPLYPKIPWRLFQYLLPVHGIPLTPLI